MGDVTQVLRDLNINIFNDEGKLRTLRDILEDLNDRWQHLTDEQKAYIENLMR